ncbi:replication-relaxation family protein [Nocardiopsis sp. NRRL B-16309]|uniref:replication-relaxation family protein n=1 Tax=Nocardiopsis sp. NRRL B-16309 TaxID=1519494 RepID=UPI0006AE191D|nr:replication-relaxation family protein [Nocardiopsis sp. NRRL B-16309]
MRTQTRPDHRAPVRPRTSPDTLHKLIRRLTPRDREIMRLVWEHRTFTTEQLSRLAFGSYNVAKKRLAALYGLRALDRFRPWTAVGSAPWHYILDSPGAEILAAEQDKSVKEFGYRRDRTLTLAYRSSLAHTVGVNSVFVDLYAHTRHHGTHLRWWTAARCAEQWGDIVRPDAAGRWTEADSRTGFYLEYDTGTESLRRLVAKLDAYAELARLTSHRGVVLFWLPSKERETHLRHRLAHPPVPTATAVHGAHPADAVWARLSDPTAHRYRLSELTAGPMTVQPPLPGWEETGG